MIFNPPGDPQNHQKSIKIPLRTPSVFGPRFFIDFYRFLEVFGRAGPSFLLLLPKPQHYFHKIHFSTPGTDFGPILVDFWWIFGGFLLLFAVVSLSLVCYLVPEVGTMPFHLAAVLWPLSRKIPSSRHGGGDSPKGSWIYYIQYICYILYIYIIYIVYIICIQYIYLYIYI